jgi:hypothetical protein
MKISESSNTIEFKPFDITITIENEKELIMLLGALNNTANDVNNGLNQVENLKVEYRFNKIREIWNLYDFVRNKAKELNLVG